MNEIIKDYIHQTNYKIILNKLHNVLTYMSFVNKWMQCHVGISFATLKCGWQFDVEISFKEIAYNYL
jgi:hypothetical protein